MTTKTSSRGCIVLPTNVRRTIGNSTDKVVASGAMRRGARNIIGWAVLTALLSVFLDAAQRQTTIPESGTTTVSRSLGGKTVKVIIQTISVVNGSDMFPKEEWLAGVKEVTLVQNVEISVDGNDVFVS